MLHSPVAKTLTAAENLALAREHLVKVQAAWDSPTDWSDLTIYGMYALEAAIRAAAVHLGETVNNTHWGKAAYAAELATKHGLPDVSDLVTHLNTGRKAAGYGDEDMPAGLGDAEQLAIDIEVFVDAVGTFIGSPP